MATHNIYLTYEENGCCVSFSHSFTCYTGCLYIQTFCTIEELRQGKSGKLLFNFKMILMFIFAVNFIPINCIILFIYLKMLDSIYSIYFSNSELSKPSAQKHKSELTNFPQ